MSGNTDPRVEAAADFTDTLEVAMPRWSGYSPEERIMLACGFHSGWHKREEADRAAGIVRVRVDDLKEALAGVYENKSSMCRDDWGNESEDIDRWYQDAVLAALRGES